MLKNYAIVALRNLKRQKGYALINASGLTVGIACCLLIALFVADELSYDRFHSKADRVFRMVNGGSLSTAGALAPTLESEFPEVEQTVRLGRSWGELLVEYEDAAFFDTQFFFTDSTFFDVFDFDLVQGNPETALTAPFSVVVTESSARRLFGDENAMGQDIRVSGTRGTHDFTVTGVAKDAPHNSHVQFNFLASNSTRAAVQGESIDHWQFLSQLTYVLLRSEEDRAGLSRKLPIFVSRYMPWSNASFHLQPLLSIHLHSTYPDEFELNSDVRYIYIFSLIAALTLIIACVNYVNLATARSGRRAKEVGIRKTAGAGRSQLIRQFMSESVLLSLIAVTAATAVAQAALPFFNQATAKALSIPYDDPMWISAVLGTSLLVGLAAGAYPALFLSSFRPVRVLKGAFRTGRGPVAFRHTLVVTQFVLSSAMIVGAIVIDRQLDFVRSLRLGLNTEQVVMLETRQLNEDVYDAFKSALLQHSAIESVASSGSPLPLGEFRMLLEPEGVPEEEHGKIYSMFVGPDFLRTLEIDLIEGDDFPTASLPSDRFPALINASAVEKWGWDEPIGKTFGAFHPTPVVVGVVDDFHFRSLKEQVEPMVLIGVMGTLYVFVRLRTENLPATQDYMREAWASFGSGAPLDFTFLDDRFEQLYQADQRLARIFGIFSVIAVVIACLGLLGLAAYAVEQRTKEIGIRKVLGATSAGIVLLFSRDFVRLVLVGFLIAAPLSYLAMNRWLEDFAYRVNIEPRSYLIAAALTLVVAAIAVGFQVLRAAQQDPVETLRYE